MIGLGRRSGPRGFSALKSRFSGFPGVPDPRSIAEFEHFFACGPIQTAGPQLLARPHILPDYQMRFGFLPRVFDPRLWAHGSSSGFPPVSPKVFPRFSLCWVVEGLSSSICFRLRTWENRSKDSSSDSGTYFQITIWGNEFCFVTRAIVRKIGQP